ncbi:DMT family transporter [uncultured Ramlibacter sp.]|uniref:DMT family transporter n=1 Tax=uncultured Ramlibacter sp. TaxID=260755 RepID=UPI00260A1FF4|nr:DMT family transporter [uncultured Ramlibacter sp.]
MSSRAILLHIAGLWLLSTLDASGKLLVLAGVPVLVVTWFRYVVHTVLMSAILLPTRGKALLRTRSLPRQLLRGVLMIATSVLFFTLLGRAPLAEATAMNFMAPLFVMALAPWLLGESHRRHRWIGVAVGFAGMLVVVRPGGQLDGPGVALGLACALCFALFQLATRRVAHDDALTTNYYGGLSGSVALTLGLPFYWQLPPLEVWQWVLLVSTGLTGFFGHWMQAAAYKRAPATLLAPFSYLQILSATALGWAVFGQLPDRVTALGIALICAAGLGVALVEGWLARRQSRGVKAP